MNSEVEKYVIKQNQLQDQIKELFAEKKLLQDKICLLNECLSYEKIQRKISELENKKKILTSLENMVNSLKNEIKPLEYLKQVLQRQLMISTLINNDLDIQERKKSESSQLTVNSGCAIETLDSLSDVGSEDSIMVLSEYDIVSDEEVLNDMEKSVSNKVMYEEALQMACSMHSSLFESLTSNTRSVGPLPNVRDQMKDSCVQSNFNDSVGMMSTSNKSEELLQMYDVINEQDLLSNDKNDGIQLKHDAEFIESTTPGAQQVRLLDKGFVDYSLYSEKVLKLINDDSWVDVNTVDLFDISIKNEQTVDISQEITEFQKSNTLSEEKIEIGIYKQNNKLKSNLNDEIEITPLILSTEDISSEFNEQKEKIEIDIYKQNGQLTNVLKNEIECKPLVLSTEDISKEYNEQKEKIEIDTYKQNGQLTNVLKNEIQCKPLVLSTEDISKEYNEQKEKNEIDTYKQNGQLTNVLKNEIQCKPLVLSTENISKEYNEQKKNLVVGTHAQNNKLNEQQIESKEDLSENKDLNNICNSVENNFENEIHNPVCLPNVTEIKNEIKSSLSNIEASSVTKRYNDLSANADKLSSIDNDEKSLQLCLVDKFDIMDLNVELLNGVHHHGFENLMPLQQQFLFHFTKGRDIIFHSYPCIGKSTMCLISVLQKIDTSLNECQAIVLVPTAELALFVLKMLKSLGKFLNISTCIGGSNVPRKVSPVPHVVISTPQSLCDMINCNSLCKDFIKILVVDDADEMFKCNGFFNNIRLILLFLNNNPQIVILSTSKLEEIFDQFSEIMQNPEYIIVPDEKPSLEDISQYYVHVSEEWKFDVIYELNEALQLMQTVIYCNTWVKSLEVASNLRLKSCTVSAIHQEMDTSQRQLIIRQFRSGYCKLLVTTELLRGEDFSEVLWVINYDLPKNPKDYIRRIVGCFDRRVKVINLITTNDTIAKENIETSFKMHMLNLPQNVTDLCSTNLGSVNDSIFN